jgi:cation diffusion facilitator family transporter
MADDCGCKPTNLSEKPVEYRRALALVVGLNLGMGVVEMTAGLLARSQALKADALDFLGDGTITGLALLAVGWSAGARTRAALLQAVFLALLGVSVLAATTYRVLVVQMPDASAMGVVGFLALVVNVASAALLLPHRAGDANARAVWLFSRNDALGNAAVILAAGAVAVTGTPWPDLVVAVVIAGLFLHSAFDIVREGLAELREQTTAPAVP